MYPSGDGHPVSNDLTGGAPPIRVVFFGMRCAASLPPLTALLDAGIDVRAVVLPGPRHGPVREGFLPLAPPPLDSNDQGQPARELVMSRLSSARGKRRGEGGVRVIREPEASSLVTLAQSAGIPVLEVTSLQHPDVLAAVAAHRPDAIVTACFPRRLPAALLAMPPLGGVNVHPSLLPVGRGPDPVFWTLRRGDRHTGATVHQMDATFDTGPILAQEVIDVPLGARAPDLEIRLAHLGARLLIPALHGLASGQALPLVQDDELATQAPIPTAADYMVPTNLPARWAYNFVRGVAPLRGPLRLHVLATAETLPLRDALGYADDETVDRPVIQMGSELLVRFRPGVARFLLAEGEGAPTVTCC